MEQVHLNDTTIVLSYGDLPDESLARIRDARVVAWDIETSGLNWRTERIATCQLYSPDATVNIVKIEDTVPNNLCSVVSEPSILKVLHHAMFDLRFVSYHWRTKPSNIADTKIASKLLDPRKKRGHSLKDLVKDRLGVRLDKKEQRSDWLSTNLTDEQLLYAAKDVLYLIPLLRSLEDTLKAQDLLELAHASYCHIPTRVQLELLGYDDVYTY